MRVNLQQCSSGEAVSQADSKFVRQTTAETGFSSSLELIETHGQFLLPNLAKVRSTKDVLPGKPCKSKILFQ